MRNKFNNNECDLESVLQSLKDVGVNVVGKRNNDYISVIDEKGNKLQARADFNIFSDMEMGGNSHCS